MPEPSSLRSAPRRASTPRRAALLCHRDGMVLAGLVLLAIGAIAAYLCIGIGGNVGYLITRRSSSVAALVLVATAIAVSTVVFQTVTANRLLTPSIMGFDSLYILLQTGAIWVFGAVGLAALGTVPRFLIEVGLLLLLATVLYSRMLRGRADLTRLLLVGVVIGMLFRGLSSFLSRVLSPDAFQALQTRLFASFSRMPTELLPPAGALLALGIGAVLLERRRLDVIALGPDIARGLGVDPDRVRVRMLAVVALMVSVSTALVGPVTFFGLLVAHLAYLIIRAQRHMLVLPAAALAAIAALVGGQMVLERLIDFEASLSMLIELIGGIVFLALILRRPRA